MARKKGADRIAAAKADLEAAKERVAQIEAEEAARIGKLAVRAGLLDVQVSDAELVKEFQAIAGRFRSKSGKSSGASAATRSEG